MPNANCLDESLPMTRASLEVSNSDGRRKELRVVEHPLLQQFAKPLQIDISQLLIVSARQHFLVPHGAFCRDIENVIRVVGPHDYLQPAEKRAAPAAFYPDIIATYCGAPPAFIDHRFHAKAWEIIGHIAQTLFD